MPKNCFFRRFDTKLFMRKCQKCHFRNITSPRVDEHRIGSTPGKCLNLSGLVLFLLQSATIGSNVSKKGVFRRFDTRIFLWKCPKRHFWNIGSSRCLTYHLGCSFANFGLIGCKSTKKCAKSTILNIKVKVKKSKCHQKIPCIRFAGNDISNYGLIFNTDSAKAQNKIFIEKTLFFSRIRCVENETIIANIGSSKSYTRYRLVTLRFSYSHFYVQNF
jgi:hypothetical protein